MASIVGLEQSNSSERDFIEIVLKDSSEHDGFHGRVTGVAHYTQLGQLYTETSNTLHESLLSPQSILPINMIVVLLRACTLTLNSCAKVITEFVKYERQTTTIQYVCTEDSY